MKEDCYDLSVQSQWEHTAVIWDLKKIKTQRHQYPFSVTSTQKNMFSSTNTFLCNLRVKNLKTSCVKSTRVQKDCLINIPQYIEHSSHIERDSHHTGDLWHELLQLLKIQCGCQLMRWKVYVISIYVFYFILCNAVYWQDWRYWSSSDLSSARHYFHCSVWFVFMVDTRNII